MAEGPGAPKELFTTLVLGGVQVSPGSLCSAGGQVCRAGARALLGGTGIPVCQLYPPNVDNDGGFL